MRNPPSRSASGNFVSISLRDAQGAKSLIESFDWTIAWYGETHVLCRGIERLIDNFVVLPTTPAGQALCDSAGYRRPEVLRLMLDMRSHVRDRSLLSPKLTELAILIAAREWTQQYEWNAHAGAAERAGLKPAIIAAVAEGRRPEQMAEDEKILYDLCVELHRNKSVSDATYERALTAFGQEGIVEAAAIEGYYALLAMIMNTARTPLPEGRTPALTPFPR